MVEKKNLLVFSILFFLLFAIIILTIFVAAKNKNAYIILSGSCALLSIVVLGNYIYSYKDSNDKQPLLEEEEKIVRRPRWFIRPNVIVALFF